MRTHRRAAAARHGRGAGSGLLAAHVCARPRTLAGSHTARVSPRLRQAGEKKKKKQLLFLFSFFIFQQANYSCKCGDLLKLYPQRAA